MGKWRVFVIGWLALVVLAAQMYATEDRAEVLKRAAALLESGDLGAAESTLLPLLHNTPEDPLALNLLGLVRMQQHRPQDAELLFRRAINTGHKLAGPHINLALLGGLDHPSEAIAELGEALAIVPDNEQAVALLHQIAKSAAEAALKADNKGKATAILEKAIAVRPHDAELLYDAGFIAYECGLYESADRSLTEALKLQPTYPEATYALARTYLAENLAKPAEDQMRKYIRFKPEDATAHYGLGYILLTEQRVDEAKAAFQKSLELQPDQSESLFELGEIAERQGEPEAAEQDFAKVLTRDPRHGGALTEIGVLAYRAANYEKAKTDLESAIQSAPAYQKAHYYYALTLSRLGQKTEAEREFALAKSLQKEHGGEHQVAAAQP